MSFSLSLPRNLRSGLLTMGIASMLISTFTFAEEGGQVGMDVTITANIVENTCQLSLSNNGEIHLPIVSRSWFYNDNGTSRLQPTDAAGGTRFSVNIESCASDISTIGTLTFRFQPQSGIWPTESQQVFINETPSASGGAQNVGVVIFSSSEHRNVVNNDGTSAVAIAVPDPSSYIGQYDFYARYQNTGAVSAGKITSHVLVDAIYQ